MNLDEKLFFKLYNFSQQHNKIPKIMSLITLGSSYFYKLLYLAILLYTFFKIREFTVPLVIGPAFSLFIVKVLRFFYNRPRPFMKHGFKSIIPHKNNSSLPSQHSSSAFAIAFAVYYVNTLLGIIALIIAFITGLSRIMVGVHYPLDVILGAVIGILTTAITFAIVLL